MNALLKTKSGNPSVRHQQSQLRSPARPTYARLHSSAPAVPHGKRSVKRIVSVRFCDICGNLLLVLVCCVSSCFVWPCRHHLQCWQALALDWSHVQSVTVRVRCQPRYRVLENNNIFAHTDTLSPGVQHSLLMRSRVERADPFMWA